jgi:tape measure domain-containing protein
MHRAAIAIQQMAGKGVISMEELRQQLGEAVPSALKTLAASLGMTVQKLVKAISQGTVAAKPALELMLRDMEITSAGAGERIANTMFGQIAQVKTGIMQLSAQFAGLGNQDGFFTHIVNNLKELNATLRSPEAQQAVAQLGGTIDHVAGSIASVIKFAIEWRGAFGNLAVTLAKVWLLFKAVDIGSWFMRMGQQAVVALANIFNGTRQMTGVTADMVRYGDQLKASIDSQRAAAQQWIQRTQQRVQVAQQSVQATEAEIQKLRDLQTTYQQNIQILTQQRNAQMANVRTAQTLNAANVAMGRDTAQSAAMVKAEQDALNVSTRSLMSQRRLLIETDEQLAVAEQQLALALAEETAATARATVAEEANATATGIMATAARGAGIAISALGEFMNVALGPIGLFIIACQQLSQWLNADRVSADEAAEAMHRYVGMMANVEAIKKAQSRLNDVNTALGENPNASFMDRFLHRDILDKTGIMRNDALRAEQKQLQDFIASQGGNAYANLGRQQAEQLAYERQNYRDRINAAKDFRDQFTRAQQDVLNGVKGADVRLQQLRDGQLAKERTWLAQRIGGQQKLLDTLQKNPAANANRIAAASRVR